MSDGSQLVLVSNRGPANFSPDESGKIVAGKYRLNQLLGTGGMAEVWSATNSFTERQIAIKFMNAQIAKTPEAAARFLKEAKVSARWKRKKAATPRSVWSRGW